MKRYLTKAKAAVQNYRYYYREHRKYMKIDKEYRNDCIMEDAIMAYFFINNTLILASVLLLLK